VPPRWSRARALALGLHLVVGLALAAGFLLLFVSGGLLALREELEALREPVPAIAPAATRASLAAVAGVAQGRHPLARPVEIELPRHVAQPARVGLLAPTGDRIEVLVDPYRATVIASRWPATSPLTAIRMLHAELYMGAWGRLTVGLIGVALIGQAVTGLVLWWPQRRRPALGLAVRWGRPWRLLTVDAHRALGVVSLAFTVPVAVSGTMLGLAAAAGTGQAREPSDRQSAVIALRHALGAGSLDAAARAAEAALPGGRVAVLSADPARPDRVVVRLRLPGQVDPRGHGVVVVDVRRLEAVEVRPADPAGVGSRFWALVTLLHYGDFAGLASRLCYAAGALASVLLAATGIAIWLGRRSLG
jgi:uncharacterized iron-regulated membrane protein